MELRRTETIVRRSRIMGLTVLATLPWLLPLVVALPAGLLLRRPAQALEVAAHHLVLGFADGELPSPCPPEGGGRRIIKRGRPTS